MGRPDQGGRQVRCFTARCLLSGDFAVFKTTPNRPQDVGPLLREEFAAPRTAGQTPPFNAHRSRLRDGSVHAVGCGVLPARLTVRELLIARRIQPMAYDALLPWI